MSEWGQLALTSVTTQHLLYVFLLNSSLHPSLLPDLRVRPPFLQGVPADRFCLPSWFLSGHPPLPLILTPCHKKEEEKSFWSRTNLRSRKKRGGKLFPPLLWQKCSTSGESILYREMRGSIEIWCSTDLKASLYRRSLWTSPARPAFLFQQLKRTLSFFPPTQQICLSLGNLCLFLFLLRREKWREEKKSRWERKPWTLIKEDKFARRLRKGRRRLRIEKKERGRETSRLKEGPKKTTLPPTLPISLNQQGSGYPSLEKIPHRVHPVRCKWDPLILIAKNCLVISRKRRKNASSDNWTKYVEDLKFSCTGLFQWLWDPCLHLIPFSLCKVWMRRRREEKSLALEAGLKFMSCEPFNLARKVSYSWICFKVK